MDISIVILNYKSEQHLICCLESLSKNLLNVSHEIIIVNNDANKIAAVLATENITLFENNINEGFAKACNKGAALAKGKILFFLNPDTKIIAGDFSDLISAFANLKIGIVSPQLLLPNGKIQPWSAGHEIHLWEIFCNHLGFVRSKKFWKNKIDSNPAWTSGGALAISKSLFEKINGFDENFFMYFEDVDICKRVRQEGLQVTLLPTIKILHLGGQSSTSKVEQKKYYYASQDYYFKKHFGIFSTFTLKALRKIVLFFKKNVTKF